jgi:hypothetical protein
LVSVHFAPGCGVVVTAMDCVVPSTMLAQPDTATPNAAIAASDANFMM